METPKPHALAKSFATSEIPLLAQAKKDLSKNKLFCRGLSHNRQDPQQLESEAKALVKKHWVGYNCQACSNCCKKIQPFFSKDEVSALAEHFSTDVASIVKSHFKVSADGEGFVPRTGACPYLVKGACSIYPLRPQGCRDFPHVEELVQYAPMHVESTLVCPPIYKIFNDLRLRLEESGSS